jgi:hypothetical protein
MADGIFEGLDATPRPERGFRGDWPIWSLLVLDWGFGFWLRFRLPARAPLHWGINGQVDGWGSPGLAAFLFPAMALGLYLLVALFLAIPWGAVAGTRDKGSLRATLCLFLVALHLGIYLPIGLHPEHAPGDVSGFIWLALAGMMIVLGNIMPRVEMRTRNREGWRRGMRLGGRAFVVAGLLQLVFLRLSPIPHAILLIVTLGLAGLVPYVVAYRFDPRPTPEVRLASPDLWLVPWDLLALPGILLCPVAFHGKVAAWVMLSLVLLWLLLLAEARTRLGGEVRRVRTLIRGWVLLGLGLGALLYANLPGMSPGWLIAKLLLPFTLAFAVTGLGQWIAKRGATPEGIEAWGEGPVLWDAGDPRVLVPKAMGMGISCNFAHASSWILLLAILVPIFFLTALSH